MLLYCEKNISYVYYEFWLNWCMYVHTYIRSTGNYWEIPFEPDVCLISFPKSMCAPHQDYNYKTSAVIYTLYDQIKSFALFVYNFCSRWQVDIVSTHSRRNEVCPRNLSNKTKLMLYELLFHFKNHLKSYITQWRIEVMRVGVVSTYQSI